MMWCKEESTALDYHQSMWGFSRYYVVNTSHPPPIEHALHTRALPAYWTRRISNDDGGVDPRVGGVASER
jgi:hypothetical protein